VPLFTVGGPGLVILVLVFVLRIWSCIHHWLNDTKMHRPMLLFPQVMVDKKRKLTSRPTIPGISRSTSVTILRVTACSQTVHALWVQSRMQNKFREGFTEIRRRRRRYRHAKGVDGWGL